MQVLSQLVANGPELLSDNIVNDLLESRQHQQGIVEMAESSSPVFGWQILHGAGENPVNGRTLAQAVEIFTVLIVPYIFSTHRNCVLSFDVFDVFSATQFKLYVFNPFNSILQRQMYSDANFLHMSDLLIQFRYVFVFKECSDPIKDAPSGQNMIPIMVYRCATLSQTWLLFDTSFMVCFLLPSWYGVLLPMGNFMACFGYDLNLCCRLMQPEV